jgi:hypothetical protein
MLHGEVMPRGRLSQLLVHAAACAIATGLAAAATTARASDDRIAVIRAAAWSPGDAVREGAGEFEVLLRVARLQREHPAVAVIGIGDRRGWFPAGAERALRFVAMQGVPVARIATGGDAGIDPDGIFLDAGKLPESEVAAILDRCLDRSGPAPQVADSEHPTAREVASIQKYLRPFRQALASANAPRLTAN